MRYTETLRGYLVEGPDYKGILILGVGLRVEGMGVPFSISPHIGLPHFGKFGV